MSAGEPTGPYSGQFQPPGWNQGNPQAGQEQPYQHQPYGQQPYGQPAYGQPAYGQQPHQPHYQPTAGYQWAPPEAQMPPAGQNPWYQSAGRQPSPRRQRPSWLIPVAVVGGLVVLAAAVFGVARLTDGSSKGNGTKVPTAYLGTWFGTHGAIEMSLQLKDGKVGDVVGTTSYGAYCTETVTLLDVGSSSVRVHEQAPPNSDCTDEDITLTLKGSGELDIRYESFDQGDPDGEVHLTRTGGGRPA